MHERRARNISERAEGGTISITEDSQKILIHKDIKFDKNDNAACPVGQNEEEKIDAAKEANKATKKAAKSNKILHWRR